MDKQATPPGTDVKVRIEDGIAWVQLNRPEKRNAINPGIVFEMVAAIDAIEMNDDAKVLVITGAGEAFSAGQDLKEYFREPDAGDPRLRERLHNANAYWQWRRLMFYPKPTIAMVNGWCFGGAFQVLCACDLAVAAEDAQFGLSEVNWGIVPGWHRNQIGGEALAQRNALYYSLTGETFDGRRAEQIGLVDFAVPKAELEIAHGRACQEADGEEPARPARRQDRLSSRARHVMGRCRGLSRRKNDQMKMWDPDTAPRKACAVPRREELQAGAGGIPSRQVGRVSCLAE